MTYEQQMTALYDVAFNRVPEAAGLALHVDMLKSGLLDYNQIADAFAASAEFAAIHDEDMPIAVVLKTYEFGLDRGPSIEEIPGWAVPLQTGDIDTGDFLVGVALSAERAALTGISCDDIA